MIIYVRLDTSDVESTEVELMLSTIQELQPFRIHDNFSRKFKGMTTLVNLSRLKQWKNPHKYRTVVASGPKGIYQVDMMHLYPLGIRYLPMKRRLIMKSTIMI
jgi:hypothetical protein